MCMCRKIETEAERERGGGGERGWGGDLEKGRFLSTNLIFL